VKGKSRGRKEREQQARKREGDEDEYTAYTTLLPTAIVREREEGGILTGERVRKNGDGGRYSRKRTTEVKEERDGLGLDRLGVHRRFIFFVPLRARKEGSVRREREEGARRGRKEDEPQPLA
jgi:hypothetical protein